MAMKTNNERKMASRKGNGEGSITLRKDGRWMARYHFNGKRHAVYGATEKEVKSKLLSIRADIISDDHIAPDQLTVGIWLQSWLNDFAYPTLKQSTYSSYAGHINKHLVPNLGTIKLQDLDLEHLQKFFNNKATHGRLDGQNGGLKPKTLKNIYNTLRLALDQAVESRKINYNPLLGVKLRRPDHIEMRVLDISEQEAISMAAYELPELHVFGVVFALSAGLRIGELLALKWEDVSEQLHTIRVRRTVQRLQVCDPAKIAAGMKTEIVIDTPKTHKAIRTVALFDELWEDLMSYKTKQK